MKVSIGILAWNEAASIERALRSLLGQSIFRGAEPRITAVEAICVPNGCTDETADIARRVFASLAPVAPAGLDVSLRVCEVAMPSKTNAWNQFVHHLSDAGSDHVIMMDGDVYLAHPDTLVNLVRTLEEHPKAYVAVPRVMKDVALKEKRNWRERLSLSASELRCASYGVPGITGCLYCARRSVLGRIWFPEGMLGEDAFLNGLITSDLLTSRTPRSDLIVPAPRDAVVVFEAYTNLWELWCNQRRRAMTRGINAILYSYLWANIGEGEDAGSVMRERSAEDADWFRKYLHAEIDRKGWWVLPEGVLTKRFAQLNHLGLVGRLLRLPVALVGTVLDLTTHVAANRMLKQKRFRGAWKDKATGPAKASEATPVVADAAAPAQRERVGAGSSVAG